MLLVTVFYQSSSCTDGKEGKVIIKQVDAHYFWRSSVGTTIFMCISYCLGFGRIFINASFVVFYFSNPFYFALNIAFPHFFKNFKWSVKETEFDGIGESLQSLE